MTDVRRLMGAALEVEARKTASSRVSVAIVALLIGGIAVLAGTFSLTVASGNVAAIAKLGPSGAQPGWPGLLSSSTQLSAATCLLAFGTLLSWMFGREFTEGTISGLFALPVPRASLATAKLAVFFGTTLITALMIPAVIGLLGTLLGFGMPSMDILGHFARLAALIALSGLLATPAAWASTLGRGLLSGIAVAVTLLAAAQVAVVAGAGPWFPVATPAIWANDPSTVPPAAFLGVALFWLLFAGLTVHSWSALELDR